MSPLPARRYTPRDKDAFPYTARDLMPADPGNDATFYDVPRIVTHIDDNAILHTKAYYSQALPRSGRILDFCSSWISHYPPEIEAAAAEGSLEVLGMGMNKTELSHNTALTAWSVQDLNDDPVVKLPGTGKGKLDASTCVVSIDYLTKPVEVLGSIREQTKIGGKVHLIISNRCFPTKAVGRWLQVGEQERLEMVGDYLWFSGWRDVHIQTLVEGGWGRDPLWVVYAENAAGEGEVEG